MNIMLWTWDFTRGQYNGQANRFQSSMLNAFANNQNYRNAINNMIKLNWLSFFSRALASKCTTDFSKVFSFDYCVIDFKNERIDWYTDKDIFTDQNIDSENLLKETVVSKLKIKLASRFQPEKLRELAVFATIDYKKIGIGFAELHNPLGVFSALKFEDFLVFAMLIVSFMDIYRFTFVRPNTNEIFTYIDSLLKYVMGKDRDPVVVAEFSRVSAVYNECITRKLFKVDKVSDYTFVKSTRDYTFIYICPMKLCTYNFKLYIKRNFYDFFKFFDSVYFKPKYLRMLTVSGLGILKRLSKFDSNVIDSFVTRDFKGSLD